MCFLPRTWQERRRCAALCRTAPSGLLSSRGTCRRSVWCPQTPDRRRCSWGWTGRCAQTGAYWTAQTKARVRKFTKPKNDNCPGDKTWLKPSAPLGEHLLHGACCCTESYLRQYPITCLRGPSLSSTIVPFIIMRFAGVWIMFVVLLLPLGLQRCKNTKLLTLKSHFPFKECTFWMVQLFFIHWFYFFFFLLFLHQYQAKDKWREYPRTEVYKIYSSREKLKNILSVSDKLYWQILKLWSGYNK